MTTAQRLRFLDNIIADAERLDALLSRLRELAQAELPMAEGETSVEDVLPVLRKRFPGLEIFGLGDTQSIVALPFEAAGIVFANLAENAAQHGASRLELVVAAGARNATILVRDNGSGISEGNRERVFQPFFSTRREQGGTGMGLDIVRTMLGSYGGTIHLRQAAGAATEFEIIVPLTS